MTPVPINIKHRQISSLRQSLQRRYRNTGDNRRKLDDLEIDREYSTSGEIELFIINVMGYASQIAAGRELENPEEVAKALTAYQILKTDNLQRWYFETEGEFNVLKDYVVQVDYLRLLTLEYIELYLGAPDA